MGVPVAFNINDEVSFKIKAKYLFKFVEHPFLSIEKEPIDGYHRATAPVHGFMKVLGPHMIMGLECPISPIIEIRAR